jgi:hypothetical protein
MVIVKNSARCNQKNDNSIKPAGSPVDTDYEFIGTCLAHSSSNDHKEVRVETDAQNNTKTISIDQRKLRAAKCEKCGAKMYPKTLLEPHLTRHRRRQRWFNTELRKLQYTFSHMRNIA